MWNYLCLEKLIYSVKERKFDIKFMDLICLIRYKIKIIFFFDKKMQNQEL